VNAAVRVAAVALALASAAPAPAHVVYGGTTLRALTLESDLVVRARITDPFAEVWTEEPLAREFVVVAEVLETLRGAGEEPRLRFVQHGHGVPLYAKGEEVLLFLQRIERSRELGARPVTSRIRWFSPQETDARFTIDARARDGLTSAVRAYAALDALPAEARLDALRAVTLRLLASPDPTLAGSALRDVVLAGDAPLLGPGDVPALEELIGDAETPIGVRIGLLAELERRGLVDGPPRWAALLRTTAGADRLAAVRAAAAHPSEPVEQELARLLTSGDTQLVASAAVSLGGAGSAASVAPLAKLLDSPDARVRAAAIRGLGRLAAPGAREPLAKAAAEHPDPDTRRRAAAELRRIDAAAAALRAERDLPSPGDGP
jgi:hypothetical protein